MPQDVIDAVEFEAPPLRSGRRWSRSMRFGASFRALVAGVAVSVLVCACGGSANSTHAPVSTGSSGRLMAQFLAYARCMRSHGVSRFPDPTTSGGIGIVLPHDLNLNSPTFVAANQACKALAPAAHPAKTTASAQKLAAELKVARCMRSHGLPGFPDPNGQGIFDRSRFNKTSPAFRAASNACKLMIAAVGPLPGG